MYDKDSLFRAKTLIFMKRSKDDSSEEEKTTESDSVGIYQKLPTTIRRCGGSVFNFPRC